MKIVYSDKHAKHDPQTFLVRGVIQKSAEQPERATRLLAAARDAGHAIAAPKSFGLAPVQAIHTPEYIDFLQIAAREWAKLPGAGPEVVPNVHPGRLTPSPPVPGGGGFCCSIGLSAGRRHRPSPLIPSLHR
jgi:acetoin utilization deacetylase AcuC-like enzyme